MLQETDRFVCRGNDGRDYIVVERTRMFPATVSGRVQHVKGTRDYVLENGADVTPLDDDGKTYKVVQTDVILERA